MTKTANTAAAKNLEHDLRVAYMLGFDNFSTEPVEVGNAVHSNSRYGRELLAVLVNKAGLMCTTRVNGTDEVWQCRETYDNTTRGAALDTINAWLAANMTTQAADKALKTKNTPNNTNPAGLPNCLCGCAEITNRNRNYRPGHDARHAGRVGRALAATGNTELLAALPTAALRLKAQAVALKAAEGKAKPAKAIRPEEAEPILGNIKIGRWTYVASKDGFGRVQYKNNKGETKVADSKQALRFVPTPE